MVMRADILQSNTGGYWTQQETLGSGSGPKSRHREAAWPKPCNPPTHWMEGTRTDDIVRTRVGKAPTALLARVGREWDVVRRADILPSDMGGDWTSKKRLAPAVAPNAVTARPRGRSSPGATCTDLFPLAARPWTASDPSLLSERDHPPFSFSGLLISKIRAMGHEFWR